MDQYENMSKLERDEDPTDEKNYVPVKYTPMREVIKMKFPDYLEGFSGPDDDYEFAWEKDKPKDLKPIDWAYKKAFEAHGETTMKRY